MRNVGPANFSMYIKKSNHSKENLDEDCAECIKFKDHLLEYTQARKEYEKDATTPGISDLVVSDDLQKVKLFMTATNNCAVLTIYFQVIMLPRIEMFKEAIFTPRIIAFNESFVPVGKKVVRPNSSSLA